VYSTDKLLRLEIDGPGVGPASLDPVAALEVGRAYFRLLRQVAEEQGLELGLVGLDIEDKCAAFVVTPDNFKTARQTVGRAHRIVTGEDAASVGLGAAAEEFRAAVRALPSAQTVAVLIGQDRFAVTREAATKPFTRRSITRLRVMVVTVGAGRQPFARLSSKSEPKPFNVTVKDLPRVQALARHLGNLVDADVALERDSENAVIKGELLEFTPVDSKRGLEGLEAWRKWFALTAPEWLELDDVDAALGRDDDEPRADG